MDDRHDLAADMNLGAAAVIGAEDVAYQFGRDGRWRSGSLAAKGQKAG
jgi:hypothetical protein